MAQVVSGPAADPSQGRAGDVWRPGRAELERSRLLAFCRQMGCADRSALDALARRDPGAFWAAAAAWLELEWTRPPDATLVAHDDDPAAAAWFPGGRLNLADNAVHRWVRRGRGSEPALVGEDEPGERWQLTFAELAADVDAVAAGLLGLGLVAGDRVGIQLPMVREAAVALLACARAGLVAVPLFSGFGIGAVADRLRLAGARAHIVAAGFPRRGRTISLRRLRAELPARVPTLASVVVVPGDDAGAGEVGWSRLRATGGSPPAPALDARHPLMIVFTSGTTGAPKGVVLTHGGFAVKAGTDAAWCFDLGPGDVAAWLTDPGWIMGPITVLGGLLCGSAVALYAGAPDHPDPARLWRVAERNGITMLGLSPTLVRTLMGHGDAGLPARLGALRVLASSGEPWTHDAYMWLFERAAGRRLPIINYSGGTEVSGAILANFTAEPIHPGGFAGPVPGMAADVVGPDCESLVASGGVGELVLRAPSPGMPAGLWGDGDGALYRATYWSRWPRVWLHGDWADVDAAGVWYIRGRSDDTLKVAGKRLGPAEVEAAANAHEDVLESAAIGVPDDRAGEAVVVFARPRDGADPERLRAEVMALITERLGRALRPKSVLLVADLPRTRSGKLLRRVVRAAHLGLALGDLGTLEDAAAIDAVRAAR